MPKKRLQSPSSINTYLQCPRKYFYKYILELPTKPTIHLVRGKIAHSVLEDFFDIDISRITMRNYEAELKRSIQELFVGHWQLSKQMVKEFNLNPDQEKFYFFETMLMLLNWLDQFIAKVKGFDNLSFEEIFRKLTPLREEEYVCTDLQVHGFIDAIETDGGQVCIMDYKTSTSLEVSDEQRLQLAIYSLLYKTKHGRMPDKAGIYFLRHKPKYLSVDEQLLSEARHAIELVHEKTRTETMDEYAQKTGPLCNYCDFYANCFKNVDSKQNGTNRNRLSVAYSPTQPDALHAPNNIPLK